MFKQFSNVKISAIASASGKTQRNVVEICNSFLDERHSKRLVKTLGFENIRQIPLEMTTSDLCVDLCKDIFRKLNINPKDIGALIFVSQTNDSIAPATVFPMQKKLELSADCYLNNIINGCSGSMHGLFEGASLIASGVASKVLVCFGDTYCKYYELDNSDQKANVALFGDGAGVVLLEDSYEAPNLYFNYEAQGNFANAIQDSKYSERYARLSIGVAKGIVDKSALEQYSKKGLQIDGTAIASYAIDYVVPNLRTLIEKSNKNISDLSLFLLHQANKTVLKSVALTMDIDPEKVPFVAQNTGNTSSAALALAIGESKFVQDNLKKGYVALSAFGVGMNVISLLADLSNTVVLDTKYY